jgi:hypothetical protein
MNPFANPDDAVPYEFVEFPKPENSGFQFSDFNQNFSDESSDPSHGFVDFLNLGDLPQEKTVSVQLAVFQNFKEVIAASER